MGSNIRNAVLAVPFTLQGFKDKDNTQVLVSYYSKQIEAHARAIVKLNKVLDKLDRLLSQRRLGE